MCHINIELGLQNNQILLTMRKRCLPASMLGAVVFEDPNGYLSRHGHGRPLTVGLLKSFYVASLTGGFRTWINHPLPQVVLTRHSLVAEKRLPNLKVESFCGGRHSRALEMSASRPQARNKSERCCGERP